jgi:hypothetical protein
MGHYSTVVKGVFMKRLSMFLLASLLAHPAFAIDLEYTNTGTVCAPGMVYKITENDPVGKCVCKSKSSVLFMKLTGSKTNIGTCAAERTTRADDFEYPSVNGTNGFRINGATGYDETGTELSATGDIDGDGFSDIIMGTPKADPEGRTDAGTVYIVFGKSGAWATPLALSSIDGTDGIALQGVTAGDSLGAADSSYVSGAIDTSSDLNNDGFNDIVLVTRNTTTPAANKIYIVFGKARQYWTGSSGRINLSSLTSINDMAQISTGVSTLKVAGGGDINGDGFDDLVIGAPNYSGLGANRGRIYVIFGKTSGWDTAITLDSLNGSNGGFYIDGINDNSLTGQGIAMGGDFNGDSIDDFVIGAPDYPGNGNKNGEVYLILGSKDAWTSITSLSTYCNGIKCIKFTSPNINVGLGNQLELKADVNTDGYDDLQIGKGINTQYVYVFFGTASGFTSGGEAISAATLTGQNGFTLSGPTLGSFGGLAKTSKDKIDFNKDGFDDIFFEDLGSGVPVPGKARIVFGRQAWPSSLSIIDYQAIDGGMSFNNSTTISEYIFATSYGDVNGDGYTDTILGAPYATSPFPNGGSVYVVFGGP